MSLDCYKVSKAFFDQMNEYSCTLPTGPRVGRVWKRKHDYYDAEKGWYVAWTVPHTEPGYVGVCWARLRVSSVKSRGRLVLMKYRSDKAVSRKDKSENVVVP